MRSQKGNLSLILGVLLLLVVGVGAYYLGTQNNGGNVKQNPEPSPSADNQITSDWKTFKNEVYSFEYPGDWLLVDDGSEQRLFDTGVDSGINYRISVQLDKDIRAPYFRNSSGDKFEAAQGVNLEKIEDLKLESLPAAKYIVNVSSDSQTDAVPGYRVYGFYGDRVLVISLFLPEEADKEKNTEIFNKLVSTFKVPYIMQKEGEACGGKYSITKCAEGLRCVVAEDVSADSAGVCTK